MLLAAIAMRAHAQTLMPRESQAILKKRAGREETSLSFKGKGPGVQLFNQMLSQILSKLNDQLFPYLKCRTSHTRPSFPVGLPFSFRLPILFISWGGLVTRILAIARLSRASRAEAALPPSRAPCWELPWAWRASRHLLGNGSDEKGLVW